MMDTNSKKQEERRIFDLVYADRSFDEVKEFENPDFLVRYFPNTSYFGVEVTDYYLTETNARIDNISVYTGQLIIQNGYEKKIPPEIDYVELFSAYLNSNVTYRVLIQRDADDTEVIFGDSGILIKPDNSVTVRLHLDYEINSNAVIPSIEWQTILGENFDKAMRDYRKSNVFSTEAVFPVKQRATQQGGCT